MSHEFHQQLEEQLSTAPALATSAEQLNYLLLRLSRRIFSGRKLDVSHSWLSE